MEKPRQAAGEGERTWRTQREREENGERERERKRKCAAIEIFGASHGVSFVPHTLTCPLHVDGIQAIKIYITAIDCVLLVAVAVRKDLPPTQPVEILS